LYSLSSSDYSISTHWGARRNKINLYPPVNILFGLSGKEAGFLAEFEVALKSVLLNAPIERAMYIHILADNDAFRSLGDVFNRTNLSTWITRNPIEIYAYDVTEHLSWLEDMIIKTYNASYSSDFTLMRATSRHTIGCFFRLIAHRFVSPSMQYILYLDTDVVVLANFEELWSKEIEPHPEALFHWGASLTSAFVVMNIGRVPEIWALARSVKNMKEVSENFMQAPDDQLIYMAVNCTYPERVNVLSDGWDMSATDKWRPKYQPYADKLPNVGMLHFNGGGSSKGAYFREHSFLNTFNNTWGLATYYICLPWTWARYHAQSLIRPDDAGYNIKISSWKAGNRTPWSVWDEVEEPSDNTKKNSLN
jgi:hypothetical protein